MQKNSHLDDACELITDDGSRNQRKADEVSVGGRLSYYLVPFHPYGDKYSKQKEFEVNIVALMAHTFTSLLMVDHDFFRKLTQDLDPRICLVGRSKLSRSLIPKKKAVGRELCYQEAGKVKAVVIVYDLWMSHNTEEIFSLTAHYCISQERKNTHLGMPSITDKDRETPSVSVVEGIPR